MKIFTSTQLHELDKYTIEKDQINSIDLMERSAKVLTMAITEEWTDRTPVVIFAGPGNNGGDALAVGRLLLERGYHVKIYLFNTSKHLSPDCAANLQRLRDDIHPKKLTEVTTQFDPPELPRAVRRGVDADVQEAQILRKIRLQVPRRRILERHALHGHVLAVIEEEHPRSPRPAPHLAVLPPVALVTLPVQHTFAVQHNVLDIHPVDKRGVQPSKKVSS